MIKSLRKRRKGFTLVELLIVIIIIGILAGSMMLTMGKARSKARATRIVSNLRTIQKAAMMYYCDTGDWYPGTPKEAYEAGYTGNATAFLDDLLLPYLDGKLITSGIVSDPGQPQYFVWVDTTLSAPYTYKGVYAICWVSDNYENYETRKAIERMCPALPFTDGKGNVPYKATEIAETNWTKGSSQVMLIIDEP